MTINDGGPAFPRPHSSNGGPIESQVGMSLRDYFAAQASGGMHAARGQYYPALTAAEVASYAYEQADAMLAERSKERK